jgi:hypothetical protein
MSFMNVWSCCLLREERVSHRAILGCRSLFSRPDNHARSRIESARAGQSTHSLFSRPDGRVPGAVHEFHSLNEPSVNVSCFLSFFGLLVSYRVAS